MAAGDTTSGYRQTPSSHNHVMSGTNQASPSHSPSHTKSVFHVALPPGEDTTSSVTMATTESFTHCFGEMEKYLSLLSQLYSAGSRMAAMFSSVLHTSVYNEIAGQFHGTSMELEEYVTCECKKVVNEMKNVFKQEDVSGEAADHSSSQVVAKSMAQVLQTQLNCFQLTFDQMSKVSLLPNPCETVTIQSSQSQEEKIQTNQSHDGKIQTSQLQGSKVNQSQLPKPALTELKSSSSKASESPGRARKPFSSLFSKFGSHKSGLPTQSAFYVNLEEEVRCSEREAVKSDAQSNETSAGQMCVTEVDNTAVGIKGHIASQDDLDLVIKMLSGSNSSSNSKPVAMDAIPEHPSSAAPSPQHHPSIAATSRIVGSHLQTKPDLAVHPTHKGQLFHRQSDGLIGSDLPPEVGGNKTNTWPFKPGLGGAGGNEIARMLQHYGGMESCDDTAAAARCWGVTPGSRCDPQSGYWIGGMGDMQKWSQAPNEGHCYGDASGRTWPPVADSSSCSDESSSNGGEGAWTMGIDLHTAINAHRRRHSSGGEDLSTGSSSTALLNKSMESLLDSKTTNTWPPKQPWGVSEETLGVPAAPHRGSNTLPPPSASSHPHHPVSLMKSAAHRPLTNQWSDPLTDSRMAVWDAGVTGGLSQQHFMHGPAPVQSDVTLKSGQTAELKF